MKTFFYLKQKCMSKKIIASFLLASVMWGVFAQSDEWVIDNLISEENQNFSSSENFSSSSTSSLSLAEKIKLKNSQRAEQTLQNYSSSSISSNYQYIDPVQSNSAWLTDAEILAMINNKNTFSIPERVNFLVSKKDWSWIMWLAPGQTLSLENSVLVLDRPYISKNWNLMAMVVNTAVDSKHYNLWVNLGPWYLAKEKVAWWVEGWKSSLGSYVMLGTNFLDNKIFNLASAIRVLNTRFMSDNIAPWETFSYLKYAQINWLIPNALDGFALRTITKTVCDKNKKCKTQNVTEDFLTKAWGICAMATTYKLAANLFPWNRLAITSRPHSAQNYNLNPLAPLENFGSWTEWADATVYSPAPDLYVKNASDKYITYNTIFSVATKYWSPINKDWTKSRSTYFVWNVIISDKLVPQKTLDWNWQEFLAFTKARNSIPDYLANP